MKVSELISVYREALKNIYEEGELSQVIFLVLEHVKDFSKIDLAMKNEELISDSEKEKFEHILSELKTNKPIQYVLGVAWFSGMKLKVNEHVLIPRQETEELVEWIYKGDGRGTGDGLRILDICTGSGCIALALKKKLPQSEIYALDISEQTIAVAKENSIRNKAEVTFILQDILQLPTSNLQPPTSNFQLPSSNLPFTDSPIHRFNILVSNPPYVLETEKQQMNNKVLNFEPHLALFVKDNDPLVFYNAIADFALTHLKPYGELYFEINESKGKEVKELLMSKGFSDIVVKKDLNERDRMVKAILKPNEQLKNKN